MAKHNFIISITYCGQKKYLMKEEARASLGEQEGTITLKLCGYFTQNEFEAKIFDDKAMAKLVCGNYAGSKIERIKY